MTHTITEHLFSIVAYFYSAAGKLDNIATVGWQKCYKANIKSVIIVG